MNRRLARFVLPLVAPALAACGVPHTAPPDPSGDWAGWAYLNEAGDLPLRFHVERGPEGVFTARLDSPAQQAYGLPVQRVVWKPPVLLLERTTDAGDRVRLEATLAGETLAGETAFGEYEGRFEAARSPRPLPRVDVETFAGCRGTYRFDGGGVLIVGSRFWGELLYTDLDSGRHGTLFAVGEDRFFAGSAMYVPGPVSAEARFERDGNGEVVAVHWKPTGAKERRGDRLRFVELPLAFERDGVAFAGTLIRPEGAGRFAAIVVLGGSNWDTRGSIRRDAEIYAAMGLAALVYDKRGYGESGGETTASFETTARDAVAAVSALKRRADVRTDAVGLAGTSRGGWFAPLAVSASDEVDFLLLAVAPAVSPAEQETTRRLNWMREEGFEAASIEAAARALEITWAYLRGAVDFDGYLTARAAAIDAGVPDDLLETADPDPQLWQWLRLNMLHDPLPALRKVDVPVLALFGGADTNVVAGINEPLMRGALEEAGNDDYELVVLARANHGLRLVADGTPVPPHRATGFAPERWKTVRDWLDRHLSNRG